MPTIRFQVVTDLPPSAVLAALTDFSDRRPATWPNIDRAYFKLHGTGSTWPDVTEGNTLAWERNRYDWHADAGHVVVKTVESDSWAPGSSWDYRLPATATGGTRIEITVAPHRSRVTGEVIGAGMTWLGVPVLRSQMETALARIPRDRPAAG
jgi:hypothetical protein